MFANLFKKPIEGGSKIFKTLTTTQIDIWDVAENKTYSFELNFAQTRKYNQAVSNGKTAKQAILEALR